MIEFLLSLLGNLLPIGSPYHARAIDAYVKNRRLMPMSTDPEDLREAFRAAGIRREFWSDEEPRGRFVCAAWASNTAVGDVRRYLRRDAWKGTLLFWRSGI